MPPTPQLHDKAQAGLQHPQGRPTHMVDKLLLAGGHARCAPQQQPRSDCVFVNVYGATETGLFLQHFLNKERKIAGMSVPLGFVIDDMKVALLDDDGREIGFNRTGEIVVW